MGNFIIFGAGFLPFLPTIIVGNLLRPPYHIQEHDKLLVIDPKLLISGGSSIHSNDFNPDEDNL